MAPSDIPRQFLAHLFGFLHATPDELRFNRRRGWLYSTWRWVALLAPEGVSPIVRSLLPHSFVHREADRNVLDALRAEATYLVRGSSGRIVHRARIIHPDRGPIERANVILVDLDSLGEKLETYDDFVFKGAIEIYDAKTDEPLVYSWRGHLVRLLTPPGFRTVAELKEIGFLRQPRPGP